MTDENAKPVKKGRDRFEENLWVFPKGGTIRWPFGKKLTNKYETRE